MFLRLARSHPRAVLVSSALSVSIFAGAHAAGAQRPTSPTSQAPASPRPATHTVKRGDTLWDLAKLYLGDSFLWPEIYRINTDQIEDPHWIYPGEVLKLPGAQPKVVAVAPPPPPRPEPEPVRVTPMPMQPTPVPAPVDTAPPAVAPRPTMPTVPTVRMGEYTAAPWVDQRGGPRGAGSIMEGRDLPGIATTDRSRVNLYDAVLVTPPAGSRAVQHERYLAFRFGPLIENLGQVIIPTGVVEVTRDTRPGEAAVARVVKMFSLVAQGQELIPYDTAAAVLATQPHAVSNGRTGKVRWINSEPVLPSVQNYIIVDLPGRDVTTGDEIDLFDPRQRPLDPRDLAVPELWIGRAQVLRVTPFGATAIILRQEQVRIEDGTAARVAAKMP